MFVAVMNKRLSDKTSIIAAYKEVIATLIDNTDLESKSETLQGECDVVLELMRKMVQEYARAAQDRTNYQRRYSTLVERFNTAKARLDEVTQTIQQRNAK
jgi:site-specific DNA recombinase